MHERRRVLEDLGLVEFAVIEPLDGQRRCHLHAEPSA